MNKKMYAVLIITALFSATSAFAATGTQGTGSNIPWQQKVIRTTKSTGKKPYNAKEPQLTLERFFTDVCNQAGDGIPNVYRDIRISWAGVKKGSPLYLAIQKCAYLGILEPKGKISNFNFTPNGNFVYNFFAEKFHILLVGVELAYDETVSVTNWEENIYYQIPTYENAQRVIQASSRGSNSVYGSDILQSPFFNSLSQTYSSLKGNYHYLSGGADEETLLYGAVQGMVDSLHDKYTVYFPPEGTSDFINTIQGDYEGVGMYVDAIDNKFTVTALLPGSPAMQAGILPGDHVLAVDDWVVPEKFSLNEVIGRIKGPAGTKVTVTIERNKITSKIVLERKKLSIPLLDIKKINGDIIFTISSFGKGLDVEFIKSLDTYKQDINDAKNVIIDLRSNGGGYVDVVNNIMNYFVPSGQVLLTYEFKNEKERVLSMGPSVSPFSNKNIIVLINGGTASASEILAGVIKDYYPTAKLVGEKSNGKGSMQALEYLSNGGSYKYTIALRYIGKSKFSIEQKGLTPDVEIIDNPKTPGDEILDKVLSW